MCIHALLDFPILASIGHVLVPRFSIPCRETIIPLVQVRVYCHRPGPTRESGARRWQRLVIKEIAEFGHERFRLLLSDEVTGIFDHHIAHNIAGKGFNESPLRRSK